MPLEAAWAQFTHRITKHLSGSISAVSAIAISLVSMQADCEGQEYSEPAHPTEQASQALFDMRQKLNDTQEKLNAIRPFVPVSGIAVPVWPEELEKNSILPLKELGSEAIDFKDGKFELPAAYIAKQSEYYTAKLSSATSALNFHASETAMSEEMLSKAKAETLRARAEVFGLQSQLRQDRYALDWENASPPPCRTPATSFT